MKILSILAPSLLLLVSSVSATECLVFDSDFNLFAFGAQDSTDWYFRRQDTWVGTCYVSYLKLVTI